VKPTRLHNCSYITPRHTSPVITHVTTPTFYHVLCPPLMATTTTAVHIFSRKINYYPGDRVTVHGPVYHPHTPSPFAKTRPQLSNRGIYYSYYDDANQNYYHRLRHCSHHRWIGCINLLLKNSFFFFYVFTLHQWITKTW